MLFKQKKAERLKMSFSSKKNLEKVVELVAQIAASERPRKLAGQSDKVTVSGGAGSAFLLMSSWSLFQSYEICLQGTKSTSSIVQCISIFL